jgi:hypothetical protein
MFNLEQSIADWRKQMLAAGIQAPVPLEELEIHLREEIEQQMKSGLNEQKAFEISVQRIGQPKMLKSEFKKSEGNIMKRIIVILTALFGTVFGGAMILPTLGRWHQTGTLLLYPFLTGIILFVLSAGISFYGIRTYRETRGRKLIGIGIIAAGTFYVVPLIQAFFIPEADWVGWIFCILLAAASILFYGNCYYFNRRLSK